MNSINDIQNQPQQIDLLVAQRHLYSDAKKLFVCRMVSALIVAVMGPIIAIVYPDYAGYVGLFSLLYLLLDIGAIETAECGKKHSAAKIQELFDTRVLALPWSDAVVGQPPQTEVISRALRNNGKVGRELLQNWYAPEVASVPIALGRFLCQRTNLAWDKDLRKRYAVLLSGVMIVVVVGALVAAIKFQLAVSTVFGGLVLPLIPFIEITIRQIINHFRAATETNELIVKIEDIINRVCVGEAVEGLDALSRTFQDELYRHRRSCPLIFDWVYWLLRSGQEKDMQYSISSKTDEYTRATS